MVDVTLLNFGIRNWKTKKLRVFIANPIMKLAGK